jgi:hypothetical protein
MDQEVAIHITGNSPHLAVRKSAPLHYSSGRPELPQAGVRSRLASAISRVGVNLGEGNGPGAGPYFVRSTLQSRHWKVHLEGQRSAIKSLSASQQNNPNQNTKKGR